MGDACVDSWFGVACNTRNTSVTKLLLPSNALAGTLSTSLAQLRDLSSLDLSDNGLYSTIPTQVFNSALAFLSLSYNAGLSGTLPSELARSRTLLTLYVLLLLLLLLLLRTLYESTHRLAAQQQQRFQHGHRWIAASSVA